MSIALPHNWTWLLVQTSLAWLIRLMMVPIVLRRQFTPGASLAWLGIVFFDPFIGLTLYLFVGENRLGPGRMERHRELLNRYSLGKSQDNIPEQIEPTGRPVARLATKVGRMPVVVGNAYELFNDSKLLVDKLASDIDSAVNHAHLLYYILCPDATGQQIATALKSAAKRGVHCRLLVDSFASRSLFSRGGLAAELQAAGVEVAQALPSSALRRRDLRNHRKLAVIDNRVAFAGSQNLINRDYGGRRGAPWVDLTGRFTGPVVAEIAAVFASDWAFETNHLLDVPTISDIPPINGGVPMQVVPTGPVEATESYRRVLLAAIQSANQRLVLTTPYFVPDDPTMVSLLMAADRGVDVILIIPMNPDHFFAAAAGRSHYAQLLDSGVTIYLYRLGLLHTKAVTVDESLAIFGSANLDVRSFHLNFELSILLYGKDATAPIRAAQQLYIEHSQKIDPQQWLARPRMNQYADEAVALISPLL